MRPVLNSEPAFVMPQAETPRRRQPSGAVANGVIKIGCTADLPRRRISYGLDSAILAFLPGDYAEEQAIHKSLAAHTAWGREWYKPVPAVLDVVNEMRSHFNLEPLPYEDAA